MLRNILVFGAIGLLAGCATVTKGTKDTVHFESEPSGAQVEANALLADGATMGPFKCTTPCKMELKRKNTYKVVTTLDGYAPAEGVLEPRPSADGGVGMAGNVIAGGIIGIGIDAGTGALNDLKPNPFHVTLEPAGDQPAEDSAETQTDLGS